MIDFDKAVVTRTERYLGGDTLEYKASLTCNSMITFNKVEVRNTSEFVQEVSKVLRRDLWSYVYGDLMEPLIALMNEARKWSQDTATVESLCKRLNELLKMP